MMELETHESIIAKTYRDNALARQNENYQRNKEKI